MSEDYGVVDDKNNEEREEISLFQFSTYKFNKNSFTQRYCF